MLLSSLAESVYWFGRYMERAENTARMILVNDSLLLDIPPHCNPGWAPIIQITGSADAYFAQHDSADERSVVRFLLMDRGKNPGSMVNSIDMARENLRTTRALFPSPVWEVVNDLHSYVQEHSASALTRRRRYTFLRRVIDDCHTLAGKLAVTTSRDEIFEFVRMGYNLERADMTSRIIDVRADNLLSDHGEGLQPFDDIQWKSVLDSLAAWQTYRRCIRIQVNGVEILRFLLKDRQFPRSVDHCLGQLEQSFYALAMGDAPRQALHETRRKLREARMEGLAGRRLHDFIDDLQQGFNTIHDELSMRYFEGREILPDTGRSRPQAGSALYRRDTFPEAPTAAEPEVATTG
jgi:uncharacterized alpha-E superfamily protein